MLDVRYPIGYLFIALGLLLAVYGYSTPTTSNFITVGGLMPLNLNIPWGILMFLFGLGTTSLAKVDELRDLQAQAVEKVEAAPQEERHLVDEPLIKPDQNSEKPEIS